MSFLSRSSANTTSSSATYDTSITTVDNRVGGENAVFGGNVTLNPGDSPIGSLNISTTDQGAIKAGLDSTLEALDFAGSTIDFARSTQTGHASLAKDLTSQAFDLAQAARQSETSGAINALVRSLTIIAIVGVIAYAYTRRR